MLSVFRNVSYAKLFSAQFIALVGTGLLTVALGLLAYDVAGSQASMVLGIAMTIKMIAYVGISPFISALVAPLPQKAVLICADLIRALVAFCLPFVANPLEIYILIFVLQAASATFTPTFQSVIPEILPDEREYTKALSLSSLAYNVESLISPGLAAAALLAMSYNQLFVGTAIGFFGSLALVTSTAFPQHQHVEEPPFLDRVAGGAKKFLRVPELRSLMALNVCVAAPIALSIITTTNLVKVELGRDGSDVAILFAAFGAGSTMSALLLPKILDRVSDRLVLIVGAFAIALTLAATGFIFTFTSSWIAACFCWLILGATSSLVMTPSARIIKRNCDEHTSTQLFTAQFALSHSCYLVLYPMAGFLCARIQTPLTAVVFAVTTLVFAVLATSAWRNPAKEKSEENSRSLCPSSLNNG